MALALICVRNDFEIALFVDASEVNWQVRWSGVGNTQIETVADVGSQDCRESSGQGFNSPIAF